MNCKFSTSRDNVTYIALTLFIIIFSLFHSTGIVYTCWHQVLCYILEL